MLQRTAGARSGGVLTFAVQCVPQVKMPRNRGLSMPKAKKKKVEQHEEAGPSEAEPAPAAAMPPPPPRSPQPARPPALPPSPEFKARQDAGKSLQLALKAFRRSTRALRRAEKAWLAKDEKRKQMDKQITRMQKKPAMESIVKELQLIHKAELFFKDMMEDLYAAIHEETRAELEFVKAQVVLKDLQLARLRQRNKDR